MKKNQFILSFGPFGPYELLYFVKEKILPALAGNPSFPDLYPRIEVIVEAMKDLENGIGAQDAELIKAGKHEIERILKLWILHIEYVSEDDYCKLQSSGFVVKRHRYHTKEFTATPGKKNGTVPLSTKYKRYGAYIWQYCELDDLDKGDWSHAGVTSTPKKIVEGLKIGVRYLFRVALVNADGPLPFSEPCEVDVK